MIIKTNPFPNTCSQIHVNLLHALGCGSFVSSSAFSRVRFTSLSSLYNSPVKQLYFIHRRSLLQAASSSVNGAGWSSGGGGGGGGDYKSLATNAWLEEDEKMTRQDFYNKKQQRWQGEC